MIASHSMDRKVITVEVDS